MGILKKFFEFLGFEDKELLLDQFDALYYENVEEEPAEEVIDADALSVIDNFEKLIEEETDPVAANNYRLSLEAYKKSKGIQ